MTDGKYPIRAASRLTGVTADSIRAWERRYRAIVPDRAKGGRLYSDEDVYRLKLLKRAVDHGHSISQISSLKNQDLESLPLTKNEIETPYKARIDDHTEKEIQAVMAYIDDYNADAADQCLGRLATFLPPRDFVLNVVTPLMHRVGDAWQKGLVSIAQEHMISSLLRNILGTLVRLHSKPNAKQKLLFTTPSDELHEFGILAAAMLTASKGLGVIYLGPNLPASEIANAAKKTRASAVVVSLSQYDQRREIKVESLETIRESLPEKMALLIGGSFGESIQAQLNHPNTFFLKTLTKFETFLTRYQALL